MPRSLDAAQLPRLALAVIPALMLAIVFWRPVTNYDLFWQLKLGELILAHGGPVLREPFSVPHLGEPLSTVAWAGQAAMAWVLGVFGWTGLKMFDALCWCGGFWSIAAVCRRQGAAPAMLAIALGLGFVAALPMMVIPRQQSFAALCFGLLLALLRLELKPWRKVVLATPLLVIWQNLHPSVSVAAGALGVAAAAGWFVRWRDRTRPPPVAETILVPIALLSVLCTPDGWSILATSARNTEFSVMLGVSEWLPLWRPINHLVAVPVLIAAGIAARIAFLRRGRIDLEELALSLALLLMTVLVYRFAIFWAISLVPLLARLGNPQPPVPHNSLRSVPVLGVAALMLLLPLLRPAPFAAHLALPAIARLKQENVSGTIFSDFAMSGPLIYVGYPQWRVAYDGRYYLYSQAEWDRFAAIQSGRFGLDAIVRTYRPAAIALHTDRNGRLIEEIVRRRDDWRQIWRDDDAAIFVPRRQPDGVTR